jgi:hypothetical protein
MSEIQLGAHIRPRLRFSSSADLITLMAQNQKPQTSALPLSATPTLSNSPTTPTETTDPPCGIPSKKNKIVVNNSLLDLIVRL